MRGIDRAANESVSVREARGSAWGGGKKRAGLLELQEKLPKVPAPGRFKIPELA